MKILLSEIKKHICVRRCAALLLAAVTAAALSLGVFAVAARADDEDDWYSIDGTEELSGFGYSSNYAMRGGSSSRYDTRGIMNETIDMDFSIIRVLISIADKDHGTVNEITLKLVGEYYFKDQMVCIRDDTENPYTLRIVDAGDVVAVYDYDGNEVISGQSLELDRVYVSHTAGYATMHTDAYLNPGGRYGFYGTDGNNYLGDLIFSINDAGALQMVNAVPLAHYVYGVISHEMSYTNEPEALLAQAVAAKCFGMCFMREGVEYDVTDGYINTMYQRYWGYCTEATRMTQFHYGLDVMGEALAYGDKIIPTFFGASNGGETTLPSIAFNGSSQYNSAYAITTDNVDFSYSPRCKTIDVRYGGYQTDNNARRLLDFILYKARRELGVDYDRVVSVDNMYAHSPVAGTQRDMTRVHISARITVSTVEEGEEPPEPVAYELDFLAEDLKTVRITDIDGSGDIYSSSDPYVVTTVYKMFWGESVGTEGYKLYVCRNGHGVGLSQHGAQAMALPAYGSKNYREILAFYYPNFVWVSVTESDPEAPLLCTLDVSAYGTCRAEAVALRKAPDAEADNVLCMLHSGDHIDIVSVSDDGCWYLVLADGHMGYLYYTAVDIDMFPAPADAVFTLYTGECGGDALLRTAPTVFANQITNIAGLQVTVWASIGDWYYVVTEKGDTGYVHSERVTLTDEYTVECAESIPNSAPEPQFLIALGQEIVRPTGRWRKG